MSTPDTKNYRDSSESLDDPTARLLMPIIDGLPKREDFVIAAMRILNTRLPYNDGSGILGIMRDKSDVPQIPPAVDAFLLQVADDAAKSVSETLGK